MPAEDVWADPRTWISIGSLTIGGCGFVYGVLSGRGNRRESRLDALSKIRHPITQAAQLLHAANSSRKRCEQLKRSFPDPEAAPEAAIRIKQHVEDYGEQS